MRLSSCIPLLERVCSQGCCSKRTWMCSSCYIDMAQAQISSYNHTSKKRSKDSADSSNEVIVSTQTLSVTRGNESPDGIRIVIENDWVAYLTPLTSKPAASAGRGRPCARGGRQAPSPPTNPYGLVLRQTGADSNSVLIIPVEQLPCFIQAFQIFASLKP